MDFNVLGMIEAVPGVGPYLPYILMLFGACAVVAAQLPPPKSGGIYATIYGLMNMLGQNYNQAKNASAPAPPSLLLLNGFLRWYLRTVEGSSFKWQSFQIQVAAYSD